MIARWTPETTSGLAGIGEWFGSARRSFPPLFLPYAGILLLFLLIPLQDTRPGSAQAAYDHAVLIFQRGDLVKSQ